MIGGGGDEQGSLFFLPFLSAIPVYNMYFNPLLETSKWLLWQTVKTQMKCSIRSKGQISLNFGYYVNFKDLLTKLCVCCTNDIYKTCQTGFSLCHLGHAPGLGLWGAGVPGCQKIIFFKHGHVAYQIDGDDEQNKIQSCKIFILGSNW